MYHILNEIKFKAPIHMQLWCDNQVAPCIVVNHVFYEWTKHNEVDCHVIREKKQQGLISTEFEKIG